MLFEVYVMKRDQTTVITSYAAPLCGRRLLSTPWWRLVTRYRHKKIQPHHRVPNVEALNIYTFSQESHWFSHISFQKI